MCHLLLALLPLVRRPWLYLAVPSMAPLLALTTFTVSSSTLYHRCRMNLSSGLAYWSACFTSTTTDGLSAYAWTVHNKALSHEHVSPSIPSSLALDRPAKDLLVLACAALL
jgi:hypothetical protein